MLAVHILINSHNYRAKENTTERIIHEKVGWNVIITEYLQ
jgi:hypothetical protein